MRGVIRRSLHPSCQQGPVPLSETSQPSRKREHEKWDSWPPGGADTMVLDAELVAVDRGGGGGRRKAGILPGAVDPRPGRCYQRPGLWALLTWCFGSLDKHQPKQRV